MGVDNNAYRLFNKVVPLMVAPLDDARLDDLRSALGLSMNLQDFADADTSEVQERQNMIRWLIENESVMDYPFFGNNQLTLEKWPTAAYSFLRYQEGRLVNRTSDFWQRVDLFREAATSLYRLPPRIANILTSLEREGEARYLEEVKLAADMLSELRRSVAIQGVLKFGIKTSGTSYEELAVEFGKVKDVACYGTWLYHKSLDPESEIKPKRYRIQHGLEMIHWHWAADKLKDRRERKKALKAQIKKTPYPIIKDVQNHLCSFLSRDNGFNLAASFNLTVAYSFGEEGLKVSLLDWQLGDSLKLESDELATRLEFGEAWLWDISSRFKNVYDYLAQSRSHKKHDALLNQWFIDHSAYQSVPSHATYEEYCSPHFSTVYTKFKDRIVDLEDWQKQVWQGLEDLSLLQKMVKAIQHVELAYCYPYLTSEETILDAESCYPVRFKNKSDKALMPFETISMNGKVVNYTGRNGSGKSTVMLTALDMQIMAQCGFPVFAKVAKVSPRRNILLSFLDRSSTHSTYQAKIGKDMAIIKAVREMSPEDREHTMVIIDELGSATDQGDVLRVVQPIVSWLAKQGVSVMMSTQIPELSQYVGQECGGLNFIIRPDYSVVAGIGSGDPYEVAKEMGLFDLLT